MRKRKSCWPLASVLAPGAWLLLASCSAPPTVPAAPPAVASGTPPAAAGRRLEFKPEPAPVDPSLQPVPPSTPPFRYEGRFDLSDPAGPMIIWQASRIAVDFEGPQLGLRFDGVEGQSYFDVQIDDGRGILEIRAGGEQRFVLQPVLGPGRHRLSVCKRSEAAAGWARFRGIEVASGSRVWTPPAPAWAARFEFIGDSITAGACDEDGATDQWTNRLTHNSAKSYAALTAAAFSADYRNISVSGMGVVTGWVDMRAEQIWDRLYPRASSGRADLGSWMPDVVFVDLGENDDSFSTARHQPFPAAYADACVALIDAIRAARPRAWIVLLRGGMYGGAKSAALRDAWENAVTRLEAADPAIRHFVFTHWSSEHPRVADHRAMADELIAWLRETRDFNLSKAANLHYVQAPN